MLNWVGSVLILITTAQAAEWLIAYHRKTGGAWRRREMGRHLMAFMAAIAAVLTLASTSRVVEMLGYDDPSWFGWLRVAVFVSIPIVLLWRRILLARVQNQNEESP